ncbi:MAG: hypothetical protein JO297_18795 [Nitrososphaeraceae archaeon]|nr:hypothetical protein [Nitrososphaeraceae archaeon]
MGTENIICDLPSKLQVKPNLLCSGKQVMQYRAITIISHADNNVRIFGMNVIGELL